MFVSEAAELEIEVELTRFSNFNRLVGSVLRFIKRTQPTYLVLSFEERENAKRTIFKLMHQEMIPNTYFASQNVRIMPVVLK